MQRALQVAETPRLHLRRFVLEDAEFVLELVNDAAFVRFIGDRGVRTLEDARDYIRNGPLDSYGRHGFGMYHVSRKRDGTAIGMCGLIKREFLETADIGFAFLPKFRSRGYGFESASAVLRHAKETLGMRRVAGIVLPDNPGSIRLLEKLGLRREGRVKVTEQGPENELFVGEI